MKNFINEQLKKQLMIDNDEIKSYMEYDDFGTTDDSSEKQYLRKHWVKYTGGIVGLIGAIKYLRLTRALKKLKPNKRTQLPEDAMSKEINTNMTKLRDIQLRLGNKYKNKHLSNLDLNKETKQIVEKYLSKIIFLNRRINADMIRLQNKNPQYKFNKSEHIQALLKLRQFSKDKNKIITRLNNPEKQITVKQFKKLLDEISNMI